MSATYNTFPDMPYVRYLWMHEPFQSTIKKTQLVAYKTKLNRQTLELRFRSCPAFRMLLTNFCFPLFCTHSTTNRWENSSSTAFYCHSSRK